MQHPTPLGDARMTREGSRRLHCPSGFRTILRESLGGLLRLYECTLVESITMKVMSKYALIALSLGGMVVLANGCVEHRVVYVPAQQPGVAYNTPPPVGGAAAPEPAPQAAPEVA